MKNIPTPHNTALKGDFAEIVLMPGDPLRSKYVAENYLENAVLVNDVRGIQGYTGFYNGKRVSVMGSGMGMPSIGIYAHELFNFYDVKKIIRIGSAGALTNDIHLGDVIIGAESFYISAFPEEYLGIKDFKAVASDELLQQAIKKAKELNINYKVGALFSTDVFYDKKETMKYVERGAIAVEMESAALYACAYKANKQALTICSISDSLLNREESLPAEKRQISFKGMIKLALELA